MSMQLGWQSVRYKSSVQKPAVRKALSRPSDPAIAGSKPSTPRPAAEDEEPTPRPPPPEPHPRSLSNSSAVAATPSPAPKASQTPAPVRYSLLTGKMEAPAVTESPSLKFVESKNRYTSSSSQQLHNPSVLRQAGAQLSSWLSSVDTIEAASNGASCATSVSNAKKLEEALPQRNAQVIHCERPVTSDAWRKSFEANLQQPVFGASMLFKSGHTTPRQQVKKHTDHVGALYPQGNTFVFSEEIVRKRQQQQLVEEQRAQHAEARVSPFFQPHLAIKREHKEKRRLQKSLKEEQELQQQQQLSVSPIAQNVSLEAEEPRTKSPSVRSLLDHPVADGRSSLYSTLIAAGDMRVMNFLLPQSKSDFDTAKTKWWPGITAGNKRKPGTGSATTQTMLDGSFIKATVVTTAEEKLSRLQVYDAELVCRRTLREDFQNVFAAIEVPLLPPSAVGSPYHSNSDASEDDSDGQAEACISPNASKFVVNVSVESVELGSGPAAEAVVDKPQNASDSREDTRLVDNVACDATTGKLEEELDEYKISCSTASSVGGCSRALSTPFAVSSILTQFGAFFSSDFLRVENIAGLSSSSASIEMSLEDAHMRFIEGRFNASLPSLQADGTADDTECDAVLDATVWAAVESVVLTAALVQLTQRFPDEQQ